MPQRLHRVVLAVVPALGLAGLLRAQPGASPAPPPAEFRTAVPAQEYDLILVRPTSTTITLSVLAYRELTGQVAYGTQPGAYPAATPVQTFPAGQPAQVWLRGLQPGARYYYQFRTRAAGGAAWDPGPERSFTTAPPPGRPFTFTITADSHLDGLTTPALYLQTLRNAAADRPDFHVDLGDTFMSEKHPSRASATTQYLAQRYYFGQFCHSAPLFLVLGNHDGETAREHDGTAASLAVWCNGMRKRYFPNPESDQFYSGQTTPHPLAGQLQSYYAWTWGDALCVVLDPYWYTPRQHGTADNWTRTLGSEQYQWLQRTLAASHARYKFVFIHHLVGGAQQDARGGVEAAPYYEWGGRNADGTAGFAAHRPGWAMPIHDLLVKYGVTAVFHGHDHLYVHQQLDGVTYQEVPQPGWSGRFDARRAVEYGYRQGDILGSSGHLRVVVGPDQARVEYVRSALEPADTNGTIAHSYPL